MKVSKGDYVSFECFFAIKEGKVIEIKGEDYVIQTDISKWTVKLDKIIQNFGKKV